MSIAESREDDDLPGWPPGKVWGLAKHVASVLDCDVDTVYKMRALGRLRARAHGERAWRFHRDEVLRFVRGTAGTPPAGPARELDGAPPMARALALLDALTPAEQRVLGLEAARRACEARSDPVALAAVRTARGLRA